MASEEMSFENVDDGGWMPDAWLYYKLTYEPSPQVNQQAVQMQSDSK